MRVFVQAVTLIGLLAAADAVPGAESKKKPVRSYVIPPRQLQAIEDAVPEVPLVKPERPRKVLVYGRVYTHPESVACCFNAMEFLGRKTGAFEAVCSGDPNVFLPESLRRFDAVVMNNTHERTPLLPENLDELSPQRRHAAEAREPVLKKSFLDFVASGKGLVGIHGATAGSVQWPEFVELFAAQYNGHFAGEARVKPDGSEHPLTAFLLGQSFRVRDEIYMFRKASAREPFAGQGVRVLLSLDLGRMKDPEQRPDTCYVLSWIRPAGKGRVFYCALGHATAVYATPQVLKHYLAGIQWAIGDLKADASPP